MEAASHQGGAKLSISTEERDAIRRSLALAGGRSRHEMGRDPAQYRNLRGSITCPETVLSAAGVQLVAEALREAIANGDRYLQPAADHLYDDLRTVR